MLTNYNIQESICKKVRKKNKDDSVELSLLSWGTPQSSDEGQA